MTFHYEAPYSGNAQFAINTALQTLLPMGFEIIHQTDSSLTVVSPNHLSTRQPPLLGMSRGELTFFHSSISLNAELGGVDRFARFLLILLLGMGAMDAITFTVLWFYIEKLHNQPWFLAVPAVMFLPFIFIAPWMTKWIRTRSEEALTRFVDNTAALRSPDQF